MERAIGKRSIEGGTQGTSMGLWTRIRQNLSLKIVSLIAAALLYVYVQQERNPTIQKSVLVTIEYRKAPDGMEVIPSIQQLPITVTGPKQSVERLSDGAVKAVADLSGVTSNLPNTQVRLKYELPENLPDLKVDFRHRISYRFRSFDRKRANWVSRRSLTAHPSRG